MSRTPLLLLAVAAVTQGVFVTLPANPGQGQVFFQSAPPQFSSQSAAQGLQGFLQFPSQRRPVNGFGFSNPPPPLGSAQDPATQTCGLAPPGCVNSRYRSIDGTCNNLRRPAWGVPQTPYGRLLPYNYADGVSALPVSVTGQPLPNPREISLQLFPEKLLVDPIWNLNAMQWGQIITHDMSLTAGVTQSQGPGGQAAGTTLQGFGSDKESVTCCDDSGQLTSDAVTNPACAPILVPPTDPIQVPLGGQCLNFVRTATTRDRRCTPPQAPAEPLSVVTAYMDLSLVYGSSQGQAQPIRAYQGGRLVTLVRGGQEWPPQDPNVTQTCESAQSPNEPCYLTGDIRTNQNPQLALLQIILLREHNRLADTLAHLNPHWSDEIVFQEARRINIAQNQHINYYEYLPIFLGYENMIKNKLIYPGAKGYINDYNPSVDPAILDEHATAAFRHFHTLIRGYLSYISQDRQLIGAVRLSDWFNRPLILELGNSFNDLTRGLTVDNMDFSDQFWTSEITQFLFKRNNTFGGDLRATDIQRGRDHGLPTYVAARGACGLPVPHSFHDMTDYISEENVRIMESIYASPADVELVVAGSLERLVPGAQAGPTFLCILTEQFYRTRVADRYFYENGAEREIAFSPSQLESIRHGASMARLLCDNANDVRVMQPQAFRLIGESNKLVPCEAIPAIDLTLWQEPVGHFK
ncbi:peroxidase isoform X2 [Plutella xylostella]|uniref:peroxidase isoform X2 n=1 Tax=Plutella xylostella TaxID=51655 RepID=UPI00203221A5|nr:peroxidase isoform X2 [Plutella xylostella]